jgi:SAM-dependent methyltransferase
VSVYDEMTYGEQIADVYDELYPAVDEQMVSTLANLTGGGRALELGIGTGRVALPLAAAGVKVHGVDCSEAMVAKLRGKPGGEHIPVTIGDFADVDVEGRFALVFVVFNTFFSLASQDDQVRCFQNVAKRLTEDGVFVIEAFVPDLARFDRGQTVRTTRVEVQRLVLEAARHDPVGQRVTSQLVVISEDRTRLYPIQIRYAWPAEIDLMARLAGLRLHGRWGGWDRQPFTEDSTQHVSVFERA